ncbi:MAG: hypothetical protein Ct9H300mP19_08720 [Dehalococcoidia bacterium]|nr:MAG: hypothetical protein Ct9H300mP19_08720 [Dehalococcoidia bacterium]
MAVPWFSLLSSQKIIAGSREIQEESSKILQAIFTEHLYMIDYGRRMLTLGPTSRKYSMPEKGHLFFEGRSV